MTEMTETIKELLHGKIAPYENGLPKTKETEELRRLVSKSYAELTLDLSDRQKSLLEKYEECVDELHLKSLEEMFARGFSIGMRLAAEAFSL